MYAICAFNFLYEPEVILHLTEVHHMNIILPFTCEPSEARTSRKTSELFFSSFLVTKNSMLFLKVEDQ